MRHIHLASYLPAEDSWWLQASTEHFSEVCLRQQDRMSRGRGASYVSGGQRLFEDRRWHKPEASSLVAQERALMEAVERS